MSPPTGGRARTGDVGFVLLLGCLIGLGPLTIDMYLPAFPTIASELGATDSAVQFTLTGTLLGLAFGQLLVGPLSDAFGRRRPLFVGLLMHASASLGCALAPTVETLAGLRLAQGFAGAAVSVTAMAMVRDRHSGVAMARVMARLMLVMGVAPVIAPSLGGLVLEWSSWRAIFGVLATAALLLVAVAWFGLGESLPPERRRPARPGSVLRAYRGLLRDGRFLALALVAGSMMSTLFAYIAGASFVLQDGFGLTERTFALVFGLNAAGIIAGSQVNPVLLRRFSLVGVLTGGVLTAAAGALTLVALSAGDVGGVVAVVLALTVTLTAIGVTMPTLPTLALQHHAGEAGTAAAVLGFLQFGLGGVLAPVVGAFGSTTALPMGLVMAATSGLAVVLVTAVVRRTEPAEQAAE